MLNWFDKIKDVLPVPRTEIMQITNDEVYEIINLLDDTDISDGLYRRICIYAARIGYPLFLRSDQGSAKHDYKHSCYVAKESNLKSHLACLFEWHLMRDLWPHAIVFRELLPLSAPFKAFHGLPIAKERRYFVDAGRVLCHHPYWPQDAIEEYIDHKLPDGWQNMLAVINVQEQDEIAHLTSMAETFSAKVPGFYSVDFAQTVYGDWIMIDAARGELSWHPDHGD